jgi:integrase
MRARHKTGSVVFDKRRRVWNFLYCTGETRRTKTIGSKRDYPTKAAAWKAAEDLKALLQAPQQPSRGITVNSLVETYKTERMPKRASTRRGYDSWLSNRVLPKWGDSSITELQPRPVELWLDSLGDLSPKSKLHIRGLLSVIWDYAMWRGDVPTQRNPMQLVVIANASRRMRKPHSLTVEQFHLLLKQFEDDLCFRTMLLLAVSFWLRISELLGLQWRDVDWLNKTVRIERGVVKQITDSVKTIGSARSMVCADELLEIVKQWKQATQFSAAEDWMFPSLVKLGRQPLSYTYVWESLTAAAEKAGIPHISSHVFRHTYRSWLDSIGSPVGVQQKLMRHSDVRTTLNIYGDAFDADMREAHGKVVQLALKQA